MFSLTDACIDSHNEIKRLVDDHMLETWSFCEEIYEEHKDLKLFIDSSRILHFAEDAISAELRKLESYDDCGLKLTTKEQHLHCPDQRFQVNTSSCSSALHDSSSKHNWKPYSNENPISDLLELVKQLPIFIPSSQNLFKMSARDSALKQVQKDIERDALVINGIKILGSLGIETVISCINDTIDVIISQAKLKPLGASLKRWSHTPQFDNFNFSISI